MLDTYNYHEEAEKLEKLGEFVRKRVSTARAQILKWGILQIN